MLTLSATVFLSMSLRLAEMLVALGSSPQGDDAGDGFWFGSLPLANLSNNPALFVASTVENAVGKVFKV